MSVNNIDILLIEDDLVDQKAFERMVSSNNLPYNYQIVDSVAKTKQILKNNKYDIIVSDYMLPDGKSFEFFDSIIDTPIIFITGAGDQQIAVQAMKSGAYDYLIKDPDRKYLEFLPITVENAIKHAQGEKQLRLLESAVVNTNDAVLITEAENYDLPSPKVVYVNDAFTKMTQYLPEEIIGKAPRILNGPRTQSEALDEIKKALENSKPCRQELINYRKDGSEYWVDLNIVPLRDKRSVLTNFLFILRDITDKKLAEINIAEARKKEIKVASTIHDRLLTAELPEISNKLDISTLSLPSENVDGDFFEFISSGENYLDILIGDVMGKGIQAALLGAAIKSNLHKAWNHLFLTSPNILRPEPKDIIDCLNGYVGDQIRFIESFVTLCYARIDLTNYQLHLVDCGHTKTLQFHKTNKTCSILEGENLPLGLFQNKRCKQNTYKLERGDLLFFYSDGITEVSDDRENLYGVDNLKDQILKYKDSSLEEIIELIIKDVKKYKNDSSNFDDITCIAVRIN